MRVGELLGDGLTERDPGGPIGLRVLRVPRERGEVRCVAEAACCGDARVRPVPLAPLPVRLPNRRVRSDEAALGLDERDERIRDQWSDGLPARLDERVVSTRALVGAEGP